MFRRLPFAVPFLFPQIQKFYVSITTVHTGYVIGHVPIAIYVKTREAVGHKHLSQGECILNALFTLVFHDFPDPDATLIIVMLVRTRAMISVKIVKNVDEAD
jgi:hypothetical protein|tara:strand:+ start:603 stop:908 length:306 start_codon:yes stop_codon:yes gene_type:complete